MHRGAFFAKMTTTRAFYSDSEPDLTSSSDLSDNENGEKFNRIDDSELNIASQAQADNTSLTDEKIDHF